ncbi:hypothetical protein [Natranaerofaba carboxydovora]|uniref:hypothetical protein n=1 Tax=Natranaerofaba carboxydovora TaxID=2742683 RepID=UPI001F143BC7|nr:hypothetical protein [Natranaerofaba carboxydovora]UMZ74724.1 hypothetical protein ACONDI_02324 [Natranaerofaba carboxydovora]
MNQMYGESLKQQLVPLPLTTSLMLVPLKMRKSNKKQDGAYGYVNFYGISEVDREKFKEKEAFIKLNDTYTQKLYQEYGSSVDRIKECIHAAQVFRLNTNITEMIYEESREAKHFSNIKFNDK